jgi:biopolymer transport protein ExbD
MAVKMDAGGEGAIGDINMTPMIDVLLVLLVIFMIAQPMLQKVIDVQIPKEEKQENQAQVPRIVLELAGDGTMNINTQPVTEANLEQRLREIYSQRDDDVLFVKVHDDVIYQTVIRAMDAAKGAGVEVLGAVM